MVTLRLGVFLSLVRGLTIQLALGLWSWLVGRGKSMANGYAKVGGVLVPCERTDYTTCSRAMVMVSREGEVYG